MQSSFLTKKPAVSLTYTGKVDAVSAYHAFIIVEGLQKDISVASSQLAGAMHGDIVKVAILNKSLRYGRQEGKVVTILKRAYTTLVGCIAKDRNEKVFMADHRKVHQTIKLEKDLLYQKTNLHYKVVIQITKYPTEKLWASGKIIKILGMKGSHEGDLQSIIEEYGLSDRFSSDVEKVAASFADTLTPPELARRKDFTKIPVFTIDPEDAKDFDDALSIQKLPDGDYQVGIHIADVSFYVKKDSPIDQEALQRGTSVYLIGNCLPMLPERLANDLCSLKPHTTRPTFSLVVKLNQQAKIKNVWIGEGVIHSSKRFSYPEAQKVIDSGKGDFYKELTWLHHLAKKLREKRINKGAIQFVTTDLTIKLDQQNNPVEIAPKKNYQTHKLIEEFMLLANKLVAEKIFSKRQSNKEPTFIYRIHDKPDKDKLADFVTYVKELGYNFSPTTQDLGKQFNKLLQQVENTPHQHIIHSLAIRTMSQARYTTEPKPHFGLNFKHYTHFTSPIRRYPDLIVHRLVKDYLANQPSPDHDWYQKTAIHTSSRERIAIEAERSSVSSKQVLFMKKLEGNTYKGIISGITAWGIYVTLIQNRCEGMIRLADIKHDYYELDSKKFSLIGKHSKKKYRLGDIISVQVKYCDINRKTTDLILVKNPNFAQKNPKK